MMRKIRCAAAAALFLVCVFGVAAGGQNESGGVTQSTIDYRARIEYIEGDVTVDGIPAEIGDDVESGQIVATGPGSAADIVFGRRNLLRLEESTTIAFKQDTEGLVVDDGTVAAVFDRLHAIGIGPEDTFRVETPTAVAGVRGTTFFIKVEDADSTYVCTCQGVLEFDPTANRPNLRIAAANHSASRFTRTADGGVTWEEAPEIYHTSESLNEAADTIGVTIPWGEHPDEDHE